MNLPPVTFELKEQYLLVTGHGTRNSLAGMVDSATLIMKKARESGSRKMLVDFRQLQINVRITEAFNIVKTYEKKMPDLRTVLVAAVFESHHRTFANYWQEVSSKRGFTINVFEDFGEAEKWLLKQD
ncbi:MAG: hypothetical protein DYG99_12335 [Bacteroidetes bacterium CHB5]|nr:hypothetical protein [Bacteroidetes bacterium CHB5]